MRLIHHFSIYQIDLILHTEHFYLSENKRLLRHYETWVIKSNFRSICLHTQFVGKSVGSATGGSVAYASETVVSPLVGGWWGKDIARAFTRCSIKI